MAVKRIMIVVGLICVGVLAGGEKTAKEMNYDGQTRVDLQPAHALWKRYDPGSAKHAFRASSVAQARQWQNKVRPALNELLGFQDEPKVDPQPRLLEEVDKGDYVRQKWLIRVSQYSVTPVYVLMPKEAARPAPVVIALHGHGYGVKSIVGIRKDGSERDEPEGYQKDFAIALCRRGFAVAAPEISCFGERLTVFSRIDSESGQKPPSTCKHTSVLASHLGGSALGLRVLEAKRLIDYLQSRKDVDASRLGVMGISGGGMLTFFTTALDERIKACVISGYFCTFSDSILDVSHCQCNYVHGLGRFGEMSDIVGLIAPRPMLVEAGSLDPIFPIASVKTSVDRAREVYKVFTAKPQVETDYFEGKHQISGNRAYDFLIEKLK
jgi:dienelactone hydrolase